RRADLIGMRARQDGRERLFPALVLETVEPDIAPRLEDVDVDRMGQIFDVEDALGVDGHRWAPASSQGGRAGPGAARARPRTAPPRTSLSSATVQPRRNQHHHPDRPIPPPALAG